MKQTILNFIYGWHNKKINQLELLNSKLSTNLDTLRNVHSDLSFDLYKLKETNKDLVEANTKLMEGWVMPEGWINHTPDYKTRNGLKIPPNTFITTNAWTIKAWLIKKGYHKLELWDFADRLERTINKHLAYTSDTSPAGVAIEEWVPAIEVFLKQKDDCDGHMILYQTCMELMGYKNECVSIVNGAKVPKYNFEGGHAYNAVLINGVYKIFDANFPKNIRGDAEYDIPIKGLNFFFNSRGTYRLKNGKVFRCEQ